MSKLSELVAVRVMGAKVIDTIDPVPKGFYVRNHAAYYGDDAGRNRCECFMPATSIADAWRVNHEMRHKDANTRLRYSAAMSARGLWWDRTEHQLCDMIVTSALRACGVSEEDITQARKDTP